MEKLDLTNFDVQELNAKEMTVTDGGKLGLGGFFGIITIIDFVCDVAKGYKEECEKYEESKKSK